MTEEQAAQLIAQVEAINVLAGQGLFMLKVISVCAAMLVGQVMIERVLTSKNSKKVW